MAAGCAKEEEEQVELQQAGGGTVQGASHIRSIKTISKDINLNYGHTTWTSLASCSCEF